MGLYQVYIAELLHDLSECDYGIYHDERYYGCPCFADDLILLAPYPETLKKMLGKAFAYASKWRYSFNVKKSHILASTARNSPLDVKSIAGEIPVEQEITHVGVPISSGGTVSADAVEERISKAGRPFSPCAG